MRRFIQILILFFRLGFLNEMEYRINFFIQIFQSALSLIVALGGLGIVFRHTDNINGWVPAEMVAVVGVFILIGGFIHTIIGPSLNRFMEDVRTGTLDYAMIKPIDTQLLVSVRQVRVWKIADIILGAVIILISLHLLSGKVGFFETMVFLVSLLSGAVIVYSFWLILATFSFWFIKVQNILVIFESMYQAGRWPVSIYPKWLKIALTFLVPVAFAVTVPAEALTGRLTPQAFLGAPVLALVLFGISRWFWLFGLKNYTGASA